MAKLKEKQDELAAKQAKMHEVFAEAGEDMEFEKVKCLEGTTAEKVIKVQEMNQELTDISKEVDELLKLVKMSDDVEGLGERIKAREVEPAGAPSLPGGDPPAKQEKTLGQLITDSQPFKDYMKTRSPAGGIVPGYSLKELKTLFQTSAGWAPESTRIPGLVIPAVTRPIQVTDIIPDGKTGQAAVVYMEETTRTHSSAERAENAAYVQSTFALTERSSTVRSIGTSIPVTDEQLEDVEGVQSYLENRLVFGNRQRLDGQLLTGDGVAPNLEGFENKSGVQTQAKGGDSVPDAVYKAMTAVRVTGRAFPNAAVFHPNDWQGIRLLTTSDGIYIWGSPSEAGPERIWGVRVVQSDGITENTALLGDFMNFCQLYERRGMEVLVGYVDNDFEDGRRTIRAGFRVAFVIYRAAAFCLVTGI